MFVIVCQMTKIVAHNKWLIESDSIQCFLALQTRFKFNRTRYVCVAWYVTTELVTRVIMYEEELPHGCATYVLCAVETTVSCEDLTYILIQL